MLSVEQGTCAQLHMGVEAELAEYRYHVFVETLGWSLPCEEGIEHDQFDGPETVYVVGRDGTGSICGCARLLPTRHPVRLLPHSKLTISLCWEIHSVHIHLLV